jgi:FkbM family methyltransferase
VVDLSSSADRLRAAAGVARSILIYYGIPFRRGKRRAFYAPFVRPGDLCFDVGAHVGNHSRAWLDLGARVVAVEPQPVFVSLLRRWYGGRADFTLVEAALGAAVGESNLHVSRRHPTVTTLSEDWAQTVSRVRSFTGVRWDETRAVSVLTLDTLIARHGEPVFCKIDVEGHELEVLRGLSRPIRALSFEFIPAVIDIALSCLNRLAALGDYQYNLTIGEQTHFALPRWVTGDEASAHLRQLPPQTRSGDVIARLSSTWQGAGNP